MTGINQALLKNDPKMREIILDAYVRSVAVYQLTPVYVAGIISLKQIDALEASVMWKIIGAPSTVSNELVIHVSNIGGESDSQIIGRIARRLNP